MIAAVPYSILPGSVFVFTVSLCRFWSLEKPARFLCFRFGCIINFVLLMHVGAPSRRVRVIRFDAMIRSGTCIPDQIGIRHGELLQIACPKILDGRQFIFTYDPFFEPDQRMLKPRFSLFIVTKGLNIFKGKQPHFFIKDKALSQTNVLFGTLTVWLGIAQIRMWIYCSAQLDYVISHSPPHADKIY